MSETVISVSGLSKSYLVGHETGRDRYESLRDIAARAVKTFARKTFDMARGRQIVQGDEVEQFWALKDVSFEVKRGEVIGVIGPNGAGKSTLLKVLSRITEPTEGRVVLGGRVASLLEVGTGFHPELTGRENIFLNGAILGMTKAEMRRKFDEIVLFAGVEKFLDTPVKRYSSGMYVRLAFSVAAHLEPEIFLVDEVLAVGDSEFQRKCLGKMDEVSKSGRTILFVSHNMAAIEALCSRTVLLDHGTLVANEQTDKVIALYRAKADQSCHLGTYDASDDCTPTNGMLVKAAWATFGDDGDAGILPTGGCLHIRCRIITSSERTTAVAVAFLIYDQNGVLIMKCYSHTQYTERILVCRQTDITCIVRDCRLVPGRYSVSIVLFPEDEQQQRIDNAFSFEVLAADLYGTGRLPNKPTGCFLPDVEWKYAATH